MGSRGMVWVLLEDSLLVHVVLLTCGDENILGIKKRNSYWPYKKGRKKSLSESEKEKCETSAPYFKLES